MVLAARPHAPPKASPRDQFAVELTTVYLGFGYQTEFDFTQVGLVLLYLSLALALLSAGEYFKLFVDAVDAKEERLAQASP